jgi:hypothetical protein
MKVQEGKFKLQDLLVVPMQRVLKYHLLLKVRCIANLNSAKKNIFSLSTVYIFSKLNMCKYMYEHNNIQQVRHKLKKFHRHVTNIN